ncbi:transport SFT2 [Fusarium pseudoanthophilum]|uniref:Protein transport protein SFT2 n=1 Tax=Fusarium pseudoanthophilum TaxID=48495 RepID=A0A8H5NRE9_9HYPO|nr:transport SFT2 [Fusarium pseudoanthophilum]
MERSVLPLLSRLDPFLSLKPPGASQALCCCKAPSSAQLRKSQTEALSSDSEAFPSLDIPPESGSHPEPEPAPHDRPSRSVPVPRSLNLPLTFPPLWSPVVMASSSFRDSINSLGWSRRDESVNTSQQSGLLSSLQSLNPFQGGSGYVRLPTTESSGAPLPAPTRREEEEGWFVLSRWDRLLIFGACNLAAVACFVICFTLFPVLSLRPRKFVILWSVGSLMFLASFAAVMGPMNYVYHLLSTPRLPFTAAYFGSITLTLVFALKLHSTILTLFSALVQLACLLWYLISYFPMGSTGLRFATSFGARQATAWMTG